ncbi:MAG: ABC transporter ATP-binding protein [Phycisphaerales bacterium]|nr:MAG: ABC transporter ATP-binding protein [Phycisphaerales bacterium]
MAAILEVFDLRKDFPGAGGVVHALCGVRLEVARGEFIAVMGASGSGKSTLLHLLGGLDLPTSGRIVIEGRDLSRLGDRDRTLFRRRRLGVVFQAFNLLPSLSARENIGLPLIVDGADINVIESKTRELLAMVDLAHRADHRPQALSGGEQQRAALARALVNDPAILLADEPTGNLDSRHTEEIWRLLRRLASDQQRTIVAVTHEAAGAAYADRILVLKDGQIVGEISPHGEGDASLVTARYSELAG